MKNTEKKKNKKQKNNNNNKTLLTFPSIWRMASISAKSRKSSWNTARINDCEYENVQKTLYRLPTTEDDMIESTRLHVS